MSDVKKESGNRPNVLGQSARTPPARGKQPPELSDDVQRILRRLVTGASGAELELRHRHGPTPAEPRVMVSLDWKTVAQYVAKQQESEPSEDQVKICFMEISASRKRARKTQTEINRLKRKTQTILDKLQ